MTRFKPVTSFLKRQPAFVLVLVATLLLTACGDPTATPAPAPATTTAAPAGTAKPQATSTTAATTIAPATASATTAVAATAIPAITVATTTQTKTTTAATTTSAGSASSPAAELFGLIPDTRENLQWLTFNDYAGLRSVYNIPAGLSFAELQKMPEPFSRWISSTFYMVDSSIVPIEKAQPGMAEALGYDLLQVDQSVQAGQPPSLLGVAKGNFDSAAIDKAFMASGATKTSLGSYPFYALPRANLTDLSPVHKIQLTALNNLAVLPDKKLLVASGVDDSVETAVKLAGSNSGAVRDNPAVKAMLQAFGPAHVMFMSNSFTPTFLATQLDKLLDPNSNVADLKQKFEELQKNPLPPPLLGGFAYIAEKPGEGAYWLADYYADAATANRALPLVEGLLRQGVSTASNKPYREYFEVTSAEVKGNLTLFKVKPKGQTRLYQFVVQRDLPIFWD